MILNQGHFYYLDDQYFIDFPDDKLMLNKEMINGQPHDRPCFYSFQDFKTGLYWMIPFSSQVNKYRIHYNKKVQRYGRCDTIVFYTVLGYEKAFLLQNMCPVIEKYIKSEYLEKKSLKPIRIQNNLENDLISKAQRVLTLHRNGKNLIFPDVLKIEQQLLQQQII